MANFTLMRLMILLFVLSSSLAAWTQNPAGFEKMCSGYIRGTVPTAQAAQLKFEMTRNPDLVILDAREKEEYNVSHIARSICVGYNDFDLKALEDLDKSSKIYVYCSIGYRSEKIGEKLQNAGFENVHNLYGGIFAWGNSSYPLVDKNGEPTNAVHGYSKKWSKWLNKSTTRAILK